MGDEDNPVASVVALPVAPEEPQLQPDADCGMGTPAGSSSECYFCAQRVYVLERISAEGKFFHRSCFACHHCGITLRLGGYTFRQSTGRFYCELHSEDEGTGTGTGTSSRKDSTRKHEETNGENDPTPSPSEDDDYEDDDDDEYYLDCGPSKDALPHQPEGNRDHNRLDCKDEPLEPPPTEPLADLPPEDWPATPAEDDEPEENPPSVTPPVPRPRLSRQNTPTLSPPVPKPRTVHLVNPSVHLVNPSVHLVNPSPPEGCLSPPVRPPQDNGPDSRPKQSLRKLQLSDAEKSQLVNLQSLSLDSDSETPGGSSSCSSSSATAGRLSPPKPPTTGTDGQEEEGYWSGSATVHIRDRKNRRCFKRKEEPGGQQTRVRSKFSPWNLSSPRLGREHRLSVLNSHPGRVETSFKHGHSTSEDGADGDDDDDDDEEMLGRDDIDLFHDKFQTMPSDPVEAEKMELKKMRTLERRAKMSELQRFRKAQAIQRRLEEIEVTFKELEEKGVELERALRQETGNGGSPVMIDQWIELVHQKNGLVSEESDLMVASRQLELEDKQSMLELELRKYMELSDSEKTAEQRAEEEHFLQQKIEVVDMRDALVAFLDEKRLKEISEEQVFSIMEAKRHSTSAGAQVHWA